jgi:hypothetical protein
LEIPQTRRSLSSDKRTGVEIKRVDAPKLTLSMKPAMNDLKLDRLVVVYPGEKAFSFGERVDVLPLQAYCCFSD